MRVESSLVIRTIVMLTLGITLTDVTDGRQLHITSESTTTTATTQNNGAVKNNNTNNHDKLVKESVPLSLQFDIDDDNDDDGESPKQSDVDEAVDLGLKMMHDLYFVKEPQFYHMGLYLDENEPAGRVAAFNTPYQKALNQAKYGYASVQAFLHLREKYPESRSRKNPENVSFLRSKLFADQCPLNGQPRCAPASKRYRTADGSCNNVKFPWKGSAMLPMQRFLLPSYDDGVQAIRRSVRGSRPLPSARDISIHVHRDRDIEMSSVTMMFMQWGQFLDHDVASTAQSRAFNNSIPRCCARGGTSFLPPEFMHPDCLPIQVPEDDWFMARFGMKCLEFIRSAPSSRIDCDLGWREQINQVTSYIDASMVYGSDSERADSLRLFKHGLLQYGRRRGNQNPPDPPAGEICHMGAVSSECFRGGDLRVGEQPGLTAFHTVWLRYHNRLASILGNLNGHWSDEKIYQETRRIIGGLIQHITFKEFLPIVLGPEVMDLFELNLERKGYYKGYDERVNPAIANAFSSAAFRFGHSLVQNSFVRCDGRHRPMFNNVTIHEEQDNPENIWSVGSLDRLILGFCSQSSQRRDEFISKELTNHLFQSHNQPFGMDLAAVNIQRGRDHGIPSYTAWREPCGLSPVDSWTDLEPLMSFETIQRFKTMYQHVDDIDLYPGGLAEKPVRGGIVGPTFACIIAQQFTNLRKGDRFWYENGDFESSFTPAQLQQLRKVTFAQILCHTLPEIETIQPFVFLTPDSFRNVRLACSSPELESFELRAWEERKSAPTSSPSSLNKVVKRPATTVDGKLGNLVKGPKQPKEGAVNDKLDFNSGGIDNKLDFNKKKNVTKSEMMAEKKKESVVDKINDNLDFATKKPPASSSFSSLPFSITTPRMKIKDDEFDVLFLTNSHSSPSSSSSSKRPNKRPEKLDFDFDRLFGKRALNYDDDDNNDDGDNNENDDDNHGRKQNTKKNKKKPNRRLTTPRTTTTKRTVYYQNQALPADFYNPMKIQVTNISSTIFNVPKQKYVQVQQGTAAYRPIQTSSQTFYTSMTKRPQLDSTNDDGVYVLHPTINKPTDNDKPDYQVNINIQYLVSSTPKTDIYISKIDGRPNIDIVGTYYEQMTAGISNQPHVQTSTSRPDSSNDYIYIPTSRPDYYRPVTQQQQQRPYYVTARPTTYYVDRFEDKPFSTSKRPYIYKPSESYLAMFDDLYTTPTRRPTYINSYHNTKTTTRRPHIPSYLYLPDTVDYKNLESYRSSSTTHRYNNDETDDDPDSGDKNFVKISSVQGNRYLTKGIKEEYIHTAQHKEGELELLDLDAGAAVMPPTPTATTDEQHATATAAAAGNVDKIQLDVIPRENRKDDWIIFNELNEAESAMVEPLFRSLSNDTSMELPKPFKEFWRKVEEKTSRHL